MRTRNLRRKAKSLVGPGTPAHRFDYLMNELEKRYPDPEPFSAQAGEPRYLKMIDDDRNSLRTALQASITALDDWLNIYAEELCDENRVKEAKERVGQFGTIAYIANVVAQCRAALKLDEQNDQDSD